MIVRDTEREARETLREIVAKAHVEAVEGFGAAVKQAGQSTPDKKGMWADSSFEDLVQYNDGFRTQLIGTAEQVAERIIEYRKLGVDLILTGVPALPRGGRALRPRRAADRARARDRERPRSRRRPRPAAGLSEADPAITVAG